MLIVGLYAIEYYLKKQRIKHCGKSFPYLLPMALISFSLLFSCFFSVAGFASEFTRAISIIIQTVVEIWLIWELVETKNDYKFVINGYIILFFIAALYGLYEYASASNPFLDYKVQLSKGAIKTYLTTGAQGLRGYRLVSIFDHPIGAGMNFGLFAIFIFSCWLIFSEKKMNNSLAILTVGLGAPCILLTKMRSAIFFTVIAAFMFADWRLFGKKRFYYAVLFIAIGAILAYPLIYSNLNIILSFFSSTAQDKIKGSNAGMRYNQLKAAFNLMMMSPIGGLGEKFENYISNEFTVASLDYESIWFEQMTKHGIVGVLAYIYMIYVSVVKLPKLYHSKPLFFLNLSFWLTYTLTSVPAFSMPMFYTVQFYYIKNSRNYINRRIHHDQISNSKG